MSLVARFIKHITIDLTLTPAAKARVAEQRHKARKHTQAAHYALKSNYDRVHAELRQAVTK